MIFQGYLQAGEEPQQQRWDDGSAIGESTREREILGFNHICGTVQLLRTTNGTKWECRGALFVDVLYKF